MSTIAILKGVDAVSALIGSIGVKQSDYRNNVSSAVLSAVAHSIESNETSLVNKLLNELFTVSYRDLPVIKKFIESVTPIILVEVAEGRRKRLLVADCQFMKNNVDREGKKQSEIADAAKKALAANLAREGLFDNFIKDGDVKVRNLEWNAETNPDVDKTVGVKFHKDVFAWFEEIEYIRKAVKENSEDNSGEPSINALLFPKFAPLLKAFESVPTENQTTEFLADKAALIAIADRFADRLKIEQEIANAAKKEADNEKAKDAIFNGKSVNLTEDQQNAAAEFMRIKEIKPATGDLYSAAELLEGYKAMIGATVKESAEPAKAEKKATAKKAA